MPIVTLSHEIGAGGPEIGQELAQRLGLHYVDQELISEAALRYGVQEEKLSSLDEAKPSFFERFDTETRRYITVLQTALYEFAEKDRVVLMGRSGQWLLRGYPARFPGASDGTLRSQGQAPRQEALGPDGRAHEPAGGARYGPPGRCGEDRAYALPVRGGRAGSCPLRSGDQHGEALDRRRRGAHRWRAPAPRHGHHASEPATRHGSGAR